MWGSTKWEVNRSRRLQSVGGGRCLQVSVRRLRAFLPDTLITYLHRSPNVCAALERLYWLEKYVIGRKEGGYVGRTLLNLSK